MSLFSFKLYSPISKNIWCTQKYIEGVRAFQTTCTVSLDIHKISFIILLEVSFYRLYVGAMRISSGGLVSCRWIFFFYSLKNFNLILLVIGISTSNFILIIFQIIKLNYNQTLMRYFKSDWIAFSNHQISQICQILIIVLTDFS